MSLEQRLFSTQEQRALLEQWRKADKYRLSTQEFCQALVDNGTPTQKKIGQAGLAAPSQGQRFVDTLQGWLPSSVLLSLRAADKAGQLGVGIDSALAQLEGGENVMMDIARLLAFPFALCLGAGVYGVFISGNILETLDFADGVGMQTRQLVIDHGLWVALVLVGWLVGMSFALPHWRGALRSKLDNWPIFSLYRASVAASTLSTLANLTRCGVKLQDALEQTQEGNSAFAGYHLKKMQRRSIERGNLGDILDTGLLLPEELGIMKVLGERVAYFELLKESSEHHHTHVKKQLAKMKTWLPKVGLAFTIVLLGGLIMTAVAQLYFSF